MKTFLVIGAGTFGHHLCKNIVANKCEVMVADIIDEHMNDLLGIVTSARIADCTEREALESFDIPSFDACFVCVGANFQASLEITDLLRELGARKIFSKAADDMQAKFLLRNGADEVIFPEQEIAERIAVSESSDSIFDCMPLTKDYGIYELSANSKWIGKSIASMDFRRKYNLTILATKAHNEISPMPSLDYIFNKEEHIIVLGKSSDIEKVIE